MISGNLTPEMIKLARANPLITIKVINILSDIEFKKVVELADTLKALAPIFHEHTLQIAELNIRSNNLIDMIDLGQSNSVELYDCYEKIDSDLEKFKTDFKITVPKCGDLSEISNSVLDTLIFYQPTKTQNKETTKTFNLMKSLLRLRIEAALETQSIHKLASEQYTTITGLITSIQSNLSTADKKIEALLKSDQEEQKEQPQEEQKEAPAPSKSSNKQNPRIVQPRIIASQSRVPNHHQIKLDAASNIINYESKEAPKDANMASSPNYKSSRPNPIEASRLSSSMHAFNGINSRPVRAKKAQVEIVNREIPKAKSSFFCCGKPQ